MLVFLVTLLDFSMHGAKDLEIAKGIRNIERRPDPMLKNPFLPHCLRFELHSFIMT